MKNVLDNTVSKIISAFLLCIASFSSGFANATATDANTCHKMIIPIVNIGINGDPRHYAGTVLGYGSDIYVSCGIPNSDYLGSTATVEIYVKDFNAIDDFACTFYAREASSDTIVGTDSVSSSGSGGLQTLTANINTTGYNSRDLAYTVDCSIPEIYGSNFLSSITGFHLY